MVASDIPGTIGGLSVSRKGWCCQLVDRLRRRLHVKWVQVQRKAKAFNGKVYALGMRDDLHHSADIFGDKLYTLGAVSAKLVPVNLNVISNSAQVVV